MRSEARMLVALSELVSLVRLYAERSGEGGRLCMDMSYKLEEILNITINAYMTLMVIM